SSQRVAHRVGWRRPTLARWASRPAGVRSRRRAQQTASTSAPSSPDAEELKPTDTGKVIAALQAKAYNGDVPAARALREWLSRGLEQQVTASTVLALLNAADRAAIRSSRPRASCRRRRTRRW